MVHPKLFTWTVLWMLKSCIKTFSPEGIWGWICEQLTFPYRELFPQNKKTFDWGPKPPDVVELNCRDHVLKIGVNNGGYINDMLMEII